MSVRRWLAAPMLAALAGAGAQAQTTVPLPPADLGQTNILDGEGGPGGLFEWIMTGYGADRINDEHGHSVPGDPRQRIATATLHPVYTATLDLMGAHPGIEMLLPFARVQNAFGPGASGTAAGVGDVTFAPFLQWSDRSAQDRKLSIRAAIQVVAPTGEYRPSATVNVGSGTWQVSPYVAVTKRLGRDWEVSARAIYDRSGTAEIRQASSRQHVTAGDFAVLDLAASREITPGWRLGLGGYALLQTTQSRVEDVAVSGKQRVVALGPVSSLHIGRTTLLLAIYGEAYSRDRPAGLALNLRLQQPF